MNYCKIKEKSNEVQENNVITISEVGKFSMEVLLAIRNLENLK